MAKEADFSSIYPNNINDTDDASRGISSNILGAKLQFYNNLDSRLNGDSRKSSGSVWSDIQNGSDILNLGSDKERSSLDGNLPLSRLLSQTYSYSSDSCTSPFSRYSPCTTPQGGSGHSSGVFSYGKDDNNSPTFSGSLGSGSSRNSIGSYLHRSIGDSHTPKLTMMSPDSPTLDDALLMGFQGSSNTSKAADLSDLMSTLSLPTTNNPISAVQTPSYGGSHHENQWNRHPVPISSNENHVVSSALIPTPQELANMAQLQSMWLNKQMLPAAPDVLDSSASFNLGDVFPPSSASVGSHVSCASYGALNPAANVFASLSAYTPTSDPYAIEKAARMHRNAASQCDATCTWSGQLPARIHKNPFYSCKVFLGGVPWDVTELSLHQAFLGFGPITVEWPGKENSSNPPKGYVYILFEDEIQVKALLACCTRDLTTDNYYFKISSKRMRLKEVQVIPWIISDSNYVRCPAYQLDPRKTVFVGALHGMLSAEGLAIILNDLFGGVVYSGIDTDKYKYPIGSGRVTFNNVPSFKKAVRAAFIEIKTPKFTKKVQVDPYLADSLCQMCSLQHGPYFCRDEKCFKYLCRSCWLITHIGQSAGHKPLMRNSKLRSYMQLNGVIC